MIPVRDGTRLAVRVWSQPVADGRTLVLVHGLASNSRLWDGAARHLASFGHGVAAVDLRGHGLSEATDHGYATADIAHDVVDVIEHLAHTDRTFARPVVAGQSWGGNVAVEVAAAHPGHVSGIVCVDGGTIELARAFPDWDACATSLAPPDLEGARADRLRAIIASSHPDWSHEALEGTMHNMIVRDDGTISPRLARHRHMTILRHLWEHSPSMLWSDIVVPVLFTPAVHPDRQGPVKREQVEHALSLLRRGAVEWFDGADHDLHAQHPERFAAVVHHHLTEGVFT
ncbi:MAG: hypothetical protein RLY50_268 [Actinomycetota bacterium]|jgi:pimeloyl-ACP methyl ester carboxylesterase